MVLSARRTWRKRVGCRMTWFRLGLHPSSSGRGYLFDCPDCGTCLKSVAVRALHAPRECSVMRRPFVTAHFRKSPREKSRLVLRGKVVAIPGDCRAPIGRIAHGPCQLPPPLARRTGAGPKARSPACGLSPGTVRTMNLSSAQATGAPLAAGESNRVHSKPSYKQALSPLRPPAVSAARR